MVTEQKSKSKFGESSDRNRPSKVSQFIPQTSDSATFKLPSDGRATCRLTQQTLTALTKAQTSLGQGKSKQCTPQLAPWSLHDGRVVLAARILGSTHK